MFTSQSNLKEYGTILTLPDNLGTTFGVNLDQLVAPLQNGDLMMNGIPDQCAVPLLD